MLDDDFDIQRLADYLHLERSQVARLVERGKLPGRRVAGQWRFSQAEIHHWLEKRIGVSTDAELEHMEGALERAASQAGDAAISLVDLMPIEAIDVPLAARTRGSVITSMVEVAARTGWVWDPPKLVEAIRAREEMMPTALEEGVALMHPRRPQSSLLGQPLVAFGRTESGIAFGGPRGALTDLFFLILSVEDREHLRVLARLSRLLTSADFLAALREAATPRAVRELIGRSETALGA